VEANTTDETFLALFSVKVHWLVRAGLTALRQYPIGQHDQLAVFVIDVTPEFEQGDAPAPAICHIMERSQAAEFIDECGLQAPNALKDFLAEESAMSAVGPIIYFVAYGVDSVQCARFFGTPKEGQNGPPN
jgi:hypothetical protein